MLAIEQKPRHTMAIVSKQSKPAAVVPEQHMSATTDFSTLYHRHKRLVASAIRNVMGPTADMDDLLQNTFLEVYRSLDRFRGEGSIQGWIYRIAINVSLQEIRRRKRKRWLRLFSQSEHEQDLMAPTNEVSRMESRNELVLVDQALQSLSEKKRACFVLIEIEQLRPQEAAQILHIPVNTVRSRLIAARSEVIGFLNDKGVIDG